MATALNGDGGEIRSGLVACDQLSLEEPIIALVDYHKGNITSVERGLVQAGASVVVTDDPEVVAQVAAVVLPGVGAFADAAATLRELGLDRAILEAVERGAPFLGICLGMHLMFEGGLEHASDEGPVPGLGILPGVVGPLEAYTPEGQRVKIPHVGWNSIDETALAWEEEPLLAGIQPGEYFYFTHSFCAPESAYSLTHTTHATPFTSAVARDHRIYGVQFHPEKSSDPGARLLRNFVSLVKAQ